MALNYIWIAFFVIAFVVGLVRLIFFGDVEIIPRIGLSTFDNAKLGFEISLYLTGAMALWLGIMKVGEKGGIVKFISHLVGPFFRKLFPEIPEDHPAIGAMIMNITANMIGLDNAATPLGLKAMEEMQTLNPEKDRASNAMIMFLVLNTSGLTILPINVMVIRAQQGAADPSDVFIPILLATFFASFAGLIVVALVQRINLLNRVVLSYLGGVILVVGLIIWYFSGLDPEEARNTSANASYIVMLGIIVSFITMAWRKKVNVYEAFVEGAKEGFVVAVKIIPFLVAMLVAIGVFRASGALDFLTSGLAYIVELVGINSDFVPAMPTAFVRPLSGSGARGMMIEAMNHYGVDHFVGRLASVMQGTTETTFYVIAVYFGAVSVRKTRYAITCGLFADAVGIIAAIVIAYIFFH
ncbi:MAG: nucleoside recognition domain-containing protein [Cyclobacteriaceae bacterium]